MAIECPSCAAPIRAEEESCAACGRSLTSLAVGAFLASRYDLRSILDEAGMGVVYRAFDRTLERELAVKVFRTDLPSNAGAVRRFRTEIDRARAISHPNVGRILDHGEAGRFGYISMDLFAGQDLRRVLRGRPLGLPEFEALSAVFQIASGVQALQDAGIMHGDLKTAHGVRDLQGVVRIVPFGLTKDSYSPGQAGEYLGTPEYMSPEHCWGYALDFRSDVYALGIVAFELLTGEVPIRGNGAMETLFKQMREVPSFEAGAGSRVPRNLVPALARALAKSAAERFASPRELAEALGAGALGSQIVVPSSPPPASLPPSPVAAPLPQTPATTGGGALPRGGEDARRDERFTLPTDVRIRKLGPGGAPEKEERTIAHDLSRSGMRVLTSWSDLVAGDEVAIEEVGGNFTTGAIVRHVNRGSDQITRIGIEFLEKRAPDRLVGTTTSVGRPAVSPVRPSPQAASPLAKPVAPLASPKPASDSRASRPIPRPRNTGSTARPRNTGSTVRPRNTGSTARPRNTGSTARPRNTGATPRSGATTSIPKTGATSSPVRPVPTTRAAPPVSRSPESVREEIATARATAKDLVAASKIWEALEWLSRALALAEGTSEAHSIRVLTWETQAKVPSLLRAAQENLEEMARSDPRDLAVHSALGRIFWAAGLSARARVAFKHVLALDPSNREAAAAVEALKDPSRRKP